MDSSTKRLVDTGLNTVSMVAFAIPGGAPVGVAILVATTLFEVFAPADPVRDPAVSKSELKAAVDKVKDILEIAKLKDEADAMTYEVLALFQQFHDVLDAVKKVKVDHERLVLAKSNETVRRFIKNMDDYFSMDAAQVPKGILDRLDGHRYFLELKGGPVRGLKLSSQQIFDLQIASIGVYTCIGSLTVSYLQSAVMWNWGKELVDAYQYEQFSRALEEWQESGRKSGDPRLSGEYSKTITAPGYQPLSWNDWLNGATTGSNPTAAKQNPDPNCSANVLIQKVQEIVDYCIGTDSAPGFYTTIHNQMTEMDNQVSVAEVSFAAAGGSASTLPTIAQMEKAAEQGVFAADDQEFLARIHGLTAVDGSDIAALGQALELWQTVQAGVMFRTHKVAGSGNDPLNTLFKLAKNSYPTKKPVPYARLLYRFNPGLEFDSPSTTPPGLRNLKKRTVVKIYDEAAYPHLKAPEQAANATPSAGDDE